MSEVHRAKDLDSGAVVALKLVDMERDIAGECFRREVRALSTIEHPGVVRYVAHGQRDGRPFLAMEWLEGELLSKRLSRAGLSLPEAMAACTRLARALAAVHDAGFVHRDVKPSNVMLVAGKPELATLLDFGISRHADEVTTLPLVGKAIGTPGYMAPEQARASEWVDARADVFSLGCLMYKCLTGRRPFRGQDTTALMVKALFDDPPRPRRLRDALPEELEALLLAMLSKRAPQRPPDAQDVLAALGAFGDLDDDGRAPTSTDNPPLMERELRLTVVLLMRPPAAAGGAQSSRRPEWPLWSAAGERFGVRLEPTAAGTVAAVVPVEGSREEAFVRMARTALALRAVTPGAVLVVSTGRTQEDETDAVIDQAASKLAELRQEGVTIDKVMAATLAERFDVAEVDGDPVLLGELAGAARRSGRSRPFVGRERETRKLRKLFEACVADRASNAVLVSGPAGHGKTRLVRQLVDEVARIEPATLIWAGRGDVMRVGSPFALLSSAIVRWLGVSLADAPERRLSELTVRLSRDTPGTDAGAGARALSLLLGLDSPRSDHALFNEELVRAWINLVRAETAQRPLCLVLDDVQWGDIPSLALMTRTLEWTSDRPFFVLGASRDGEAPGFLERLELGALSSEASAFLARSIAGDALSAQALKDIVRRGDGNPFAIEALVQSMLEGDSSVPETALTVADMHLQRASPSARRVLRAASLYGDVFWTDATRAVLDDVLVEHELEELLALGLVRRGGLDRLRRHDQFHFPHSLLREAAYASLTPQDREAGHRIAAAWLEQAGETDPWPIAEHHRLGNEAATAIQHYRRSAALAFEAGDFETVVTRVNRALTSVSSDALAPEICCELFVMRAEAERWRGEPRIALEDAVRARDSALEGSAEYFRALGEMVSALGRLGDYERLGAELMRAVGVAAEGSARAAKVVALSPGSTQLAQAGRHEEASAVRTCVEELVAQGSLSALATLRVEQLRGFHAMVQGEPWRAAEHFGRARHGFLELGSSRNAAVEGVNEAHAAIEAGDYDHAMDVLRGTLETAKLLGLTAVQAFAHLNFGRLLLELGRVDEAEAEERTALQLGMRERGARIVGAARIQLARLALARGDAGLAEAEALTAVELLEIVPPLRAAARAMLARALLAGGRADEALEHARRAARAADQERGALFDALVRATHAQALLAAGRESEAREVARAAWDKLVARAEGRERFLSAPLFHRELRALSGSS